MTMTLDPLLSPRSIAVIGASANPDKHGNIVIRHLLGSGFSGAIYPINPSTREVEGLRCYPDIGAVGADVDCAMIVLPAAQTVEAVAECARHGVRSAVLGGGGFAETGTEAGRARQDTVSRIARETGIRLLGPNTNGFVHMHVGLSLGYNAEHGAALVPGPISVISHSGAVFGGVVRVLRNLGQGIGAFVPVGNEADIGMLDVLDHLIADDRTQVIRLIIEGIDDGARLRRLADRARDAGKSIVALKVGRSAVGSEAALAHSSRLAGSARAFDALMQAAGIASVRSVEALAGGCAVLADRPRGRDLSQIDQRLTCTTTSGAGGALMADFAAERGIAMAGDATGEWQGSAAARIAELPLSGRVRNPIDTGSLRGDWSRLDDIYAAIEADGVAGPMAVYAHIAPKPSMDEKLIAALTGRKRRTGMPVVIVAPGGLRPEVETAFRDRGLPLFHDIGTGFDALSCHYATLPASPAPPAAPTGADPALPAAAADALHAAIDALLSRPAAGEELSETASADLLRRVGIPIVSSHSVPTAHEARAIAAGLGWPVVLKALAPGIAHKAASGLVLTRIRDAEALSEGHARLTERLSALGLARSDCDIILQPMLAGWLELIVGSTCEAGLGQFLIFGLGGIHAEILDQTVLISVPATRSRIRAAVAASTAGRIIAQDNDPARRDRFLDLLTDILMRLQKFVEVAGDRISSVDLNPVLVCDDDVLAVDALVVLDRPNRQGQEPAPGEAAQDRPGDGNTS
jgi:acetate---CoA ligase (ADP-forming)